MPHQPLPASLRDGMPSGRFASSSLQGSEEEMNKADSNLLSSSPPLLEEDVTSVRAVNGNVAHGARLIFIGLVVQRQERREPVALNAQIVNVVAGQEPRIVRAMRHMACRAAFGLHGQMVEDERPALLRMAFEADLVLRRADLRGFWQAAVNVVTVLALHQSFVHPMMEGTVKVGNRVGVLEEANGLV